MNVASKWTLVLGASRLFTRTLKTLGVKNDGHSAPSWERPRFLKDGDIAQRVVWGWRLVFMILFTLVLILTLRFEFLYDFYCGFVHCIMFLKIRVIQQVGKQEFSRSDPIVVYFFHCGSGRVRFRWTLFLSD